MGRKLSRKVAYVVFRGRKPGIYHSWKECNEQVKGFAGNSHQGYENVCDAQSAWNDWITELSEVLNIPNSGLGAQIPLNQNDGNTTAPLNRADTFPAKSPKLEETNDGSGLYQCHPSLKRSTSFVDLTCSEDEQEPPLKKLKPEADAFEDDLEFIPLEVAESLNLEESPITLTAAQQAVVNMALKGDNIFLTGAAGSGKTATLKEILRRLNARYRDAHRKYPSVQVVAPTGIAALPLEGKTTYSFAGWKPDSFQQPMQRLLERSKESVRGAMEKLKVLIIEEISMVENQFLERLNILMQYILVSARPFGGKQVIFLGDFHQLPPVKPFQFCLNCGEPVMRRGTQFICNSERCTSEGIEMAFKPGDKWAFKAPVWMQLNLRHVKLEQIHRQKDTRFQDILNKIRNGSLLSNEEWDTLSAKKELPAGAFAVRLMSRLFKVKDFNEARLKSIKSEAKTWNALDASRKLYYDREDKFPPRSAEILRRLEDHKESLKEHRFPTRLTLKVGAKVVLLSNLNHELGLVNGSQGEVVSFVDTQGWGGEPEGKGKGKGKGKSKEWQDSLLDIYQKTESFVVPIVRFTSGRIKAIRPVVSESLKGTSTDRYVICRTQIPLTLAWALSIHKSQGMTLQYVEVSSEDIFEDGQLYVGLSRATTLEGLTVTGYSREQTSMDKDVLAFYENTRWEVLGPSNISGAGDAPVDEEVNAPTREREKPTVIEIASSDNEDEEIC